MVRGHTTSRDQSLSTIARVSLRHLPPTLFIAILIFLGQVEVFETHVFVALSAAFTQMSYVQWYCLAVRRCGARIRTLRGRVGISSRSDHELALLLHNVQLDLGGHSVFSTSIQLT